MIYPTSSNTLSAAGLWRASAGESLQETTMGAAIAPIVVYSEMQSLKMYSYFFVTLRPAPLGFCENFLLKH